jgi:signal transduction histidine kinase
LPVVGDNQILDDPQRAQLLADVAGAVAWSSGFVGALRRLAELSVPRLADWCMIDIVDGATGYRRLVVVHGDPRCRPQAERLLGRRELDPRRHGVARVMRCGERDVVRERADPAALVPAAHAESERLVGELGVTGYVSVPLVAGARPLGAFTLVAAGRGRQFTDAEVALAETLARVAALRIAENRLGREFADLARRQDDVLAGLSHELRTPLTAMMAWLELLHHPADGQQTTHALHVIERNGQLLGRLIDDLMDTSHIVMGTLHVDHRPVDLPAIVHHAALDLAARARDKGVRVDVQVDGAVGPYAGDRGRLSQIVAALLSNAVKFTPGGGRVVVRLDGDAAVVRLRVSDTGRGIARELLPHVFDVFRRDGHASGLGIGLAMARGLVRLHGGTVHAASEGVGRGATFTVTLPRC